MKNLPFMKPLVQRWRQEPSGVIAPVDVVIDATTDPRRPFRLWMTGSLAVVMAAMIPMRAMAETDRGQNRLLRHSRFGVSETLQRIETAASDRGLSVLARMPGERILLVLASSIGGTLAVMDEADSSPAMPLSLMISGTTDGGADVLLAAGEASSDWSELPASVAEDLRALPGVVEQALG